MSDNGLSPLELEMLLGADAGMDMGDMLDYGGDPLLAMMLGGGAYNPASFDPTYEEEVIPAITEGADLLNSIATKSPNSVEALIAQGIMSGMSPTQVIQRLTQEGVIQVPKKKDQYGQPTQEDDTSQVDKWEKVANGWWEKYLSDKEEQRIQKEIPNKNMERIQALGFTDPRLTYDDIIQPDFSKSDSAKQGYDAKRGEYDEARKAMERAQWNVKNPNAEAVGGDVAGFLSGRGRQDTNAGTFNPLRNAMDGMRQAATGASQMTMSPVPTNVPWKVVEGKDYMGSSYDVEGGTFAQPLQFDWGAAMGTIPGPQQGPQLSDVDPNLKRLMEQSTQASAGRDKALAGRRSAWKDYQAAVHEDDMNAWKTRAVRDFLRQSGRTPFADEFAARLAGARQTQR